MSFSISGWAFNNQAMIHHLRSSKICFSSSPFTFPLSMSLTLRETCFINSGSVIVSSSSTYLLFQRLDLPLNFYLSRQDHFPQPEVWCVYLSQLLRSYFQIIVLLSLSKFLKMSGLYDRFFQEGWRLSRAGSDVGQKWWVRWSLISIIVISSRTLWLGLKISHRRMVKSNAIKSCVGKDFTETLEAITPHVLSYAFTTHLSGNRCHPKVIQLLRGDADANMLDRYTQFTSEQVRQEYIRTIPKLGI